MTGLRKTARVPAPSKALPPSKPLPPLQGARDLWPGLSVVPITVRAWMSYFSLNLSFVICKVGRLDQMISGASDCIQDSMPEGCSVTRRQKCRESSYEWFLITRTDRVCIQEALVWDCPSRLSLLLTALLLCPERELAVPLI